MAMGLRKKVYDPAKESADLGFGSALTERRAYRLLNRDGSFNVDHPTDRTWHTFTSYHSLINMSWPRFFVVVTLGYTLLNAIFALAYLACGPAGLKGEEQLHPLWRTFVFSIHTFATIGYGSIVPEGTATNILVAIESLVGLLSFALATGLLFARFSRPVAKIVYSRQAVIAPYRGITALMFRIVNGAENQLIDVSARVTVGRFEEVEGVRKRLFHSLSLERDRVNFFPLAWTIVHPIDENSPLLGWTEKMLHDSDAEVFVLMTATDETFSQVVSSRSSYVHDEVVWGARFVPILEDGKRPTIDMDKFHAITPASLETTA
jgi:inward rectifier potassium channel